MSPVASEAAPNIAAGLAQSSPFSEAASALHAAGYSPIPIDAGSKAPGEYTWIDELGAQGWRPMRNWTTYCGAPAGGRRIAYWSGWPAANIGVALGFNNVVAVDIDDDELLDPLLAVLPPPVVAKRGRKGLTCFYRVANSAAFPSKGFRDKTRNIGLADFLSTGKQTVVPPSIHPDTDAPYAWKDDVSLAEVPPAGLSELTADHYAAMLDVLRAHGWEAEPERPARAIEPRGVDGAADDWRRVNEAALANLDAWVPKLGLERLRRAPDGFRSVAQWRPSYSGKALGKRERRVSIKSNGIVDFGDAEKGYTPIDLAMAARKCAPQEALHWLAPLVGVDLDAPVAGVDAAAIRANTEARRVAADDAERAAPAEGREYDLVLVVRSDGSTWEPDGEGGDPIKAGWNHVSVSTNIEPRGLGFGGEKFKPWKPFTGIDEKAGLLRQIVFPHAGLRVINSPLRTSRAWVWAVAWAVAVEAAEAIRLPLPKDADALMAAIDAAVERAPALEMLRKAERDYLGAPYPVDMLGPILSEAAKAVAEEIQAPLSMAANSVLGGACLAAQAIADVRLPRPDQTRPLSLYMLTIADSGDRKSSADREAMEATRAHEAKLRDSYVRDMEHHKAEAAAWKAEQTGIMRNSKIDFEMRKLLLGQLGPEPAAPLLPVLTIDEGTAEGLAKHLPRMHQAVGIFSDEGAQFLGGHGFTAETKRATIGFFCSFWDDGSARRLRAGGELVDIVNRRLAMHLQTQPSVAAGALEDPDIIGQGLRARILIAAPASLAGFREARPVRPEWRRAILAYQQQAKIAFESAPLANADGEIIRETLCLDAEAESAWLEFYNAVEFDQRPGRRFNAIKDIASKAAEYAARIAGNMTIFVNPCAKEIDGDTMLRAIGLMEWYLGEWLRVLAKAEVAAGDTNADKLRKWVASRYPQGVTFRAIARDAPWSVRKDDRIRDGAIKTLEGEGFLVVVPSRKGRRWSVAA